MTVAIKQLTKCASQCVPVAPCRSRSGEACNIAWPAWWERRIRRLKEQEEVARRELAAARKASEQDELAMQRYQQARAKSREGREVGFDAERDMWERAAEDQVGVQQASDVAWGPKMPAFPLGVPRTQKAVERTHDRVHCADTPPPHCKIRQICRVVYITGRGWRVCLRRCRLVAPTRRARRLWRRRRTFARRLHRWRRGRSGRRAAKIS
jgi:hypothetical protein